jgi:hypothetical protein
MPGGGGGAFYDEFENLPLAAYTASISGTQFRQEQAKGTMFIIYVKVAGASTLQFRCSAVNPIEAQGWVPTVNVSIPGVGVFVVICHPFVDRQPAGEVAATVNTSVVLQCVRMPAPWIWRGSLVKGDASSWTFGMRARRLR